MPKETDLEENLLLQNPMIATENILTSNIYIVPDTTLSF